MIALFEILQIKKKKSQEEWTVILDNTAYDGTQN